MTVSVGTTVQLRHLRTPCLVTRLVGEGAQGRVFAVSLDVAGRTHEYALKWYRTGFATARQQSILERLVERGCPSDRFLWPIDLAESLGDESFGYVMPLRPEGYVPLSDLVNGRCQTSARTIATVGEELASCFLVLHAAGLCYRDINLGNVFIHPDTGAVLVCDLDNAGVDGEETAEIAGSPFFSAPEIVRGDALPSIATDRFSLAVLLFLLLFLHHPLEGSLVLDYDVADDADLQMYGVEPCFVFDPDDPSNRPVPGLHDDVAMYWSLYPPFLRALFIEAFTDGLRDPSARVTEGAWRRAMSRLRDAVITCPACDCDAFYDEQRRAASCWSCGQQIPLPRSLELRGSRLFLAPGTVVTTHHLEQNFDETPVAEVVAHPDDATILGLRNLTPVPWTVGRKDIKPATIGSGRSIAIVDGLWVEFAPGRRGHVEDPAEEL